MALRLVDKDRQLALIDAALASNRLEEAAQEFITLIEGRNVKHASLLEEGHIGRILDAIAKKEPSLAVQTAERALKTLPVLTRVAAVDCLLACAASSGGKDTGLALKALNTAARYSAGDAEHVEKTVSQLVTCAGLWKDVDAKSAFEAASSALSFSSSDSVLHQDVEAQVLALNLPGLAP